MNPNPEPFSDPLIDEVRQRRQQVWDECGRDVRKLYERIKKIQDSHPEQLIYPSVVPVNDDPVAQKATQENAA